MDTKRAAAIVAMETPLLTVPMVFPSIPLWLGVLSWVLAGALLLYAASDLLSSKVVKMRNTQNAVQPNWWPLHLVLRHIALHSEWAYKIPDCDEKILEEKLKHVFLEAGARGDIEARGSIQIDRSSGKFTLASESIPSEFWSCAFIKPFAEIVLADDNRSAATRDGDFYEYAPDAFYRKIIVRKDQVFRQWPCAQKVTRKTKLNPFRRALIERSQRDGVQFDDEFGLLISGYPKTNC